LQCPIKKGVIKAIIFTAVRSPPPGISLKSAFKISKSRKREKILGLMGRIKHYPW
jgi:hypothetical protein